MISLLHNYTISLPFFMKQRREMTNLKSCGGRQEMTLKPCFSLKISNLGKDQFFIFTNLVEPVVSQVALNTV